MTEGGTNGDGVGPYRIVREIGRGGSGIVYQAVAPDGSALAVKRLHAHTSAGADAAEIEVLAGLQHPGVVRILDHGTAGGQRYVATELLDGPTLRSFLRGGAAPVTLDLDAPSDGGWGGGVDPIARQALGQVAHTLAWLHGEGVVHRDLKPENVLWTAGRAVIIDFGLATTVEAREAVERLRGGTPGYMPREQARGDAVDARADLYAFGRMLVEAGADSDPDLDELLPGLLADRPEQRVADLVAVGRALGVPAFGPAPRRVVYRPPLVGRDEVLAAIDDRLAVNAPLLVAAPAGRGRTRIALEAAARARRRATCFVGHRSGPLAAFESLIRAACTRPEAPDPAEQAALAAVAAWVGVPAPWPAPGPLEDEPRRARDIAGVVVAWRRASAARPVLFAFDDLHAADPLTLEATLRLAAAIGAGELAGTLLATWDTDAAPVPAPVLRAFGAPIPLLPLSTAQLEALCRAAAPSARDAVRAAACRLAEGSPLLCVDGLRIPEGGTLAETYEERALARLRVLPRATRDLIDAAAVNDAPAPLDRLLRAVGLSEREGAMAAHAARRDGFLEVDEGWVRVPHRRLADAVRGDVPPERAQALHRRFADGADGCRRGDHLWAADDTDAAIAAWSHAARTHVDPRERRDAVDRLVAMDATLPDDLAIAHAAATRDRGDRDRAAALALALLPADDADRAAARLLAATCLPRTDPRAVGCLADARACAERAGRADLVAEVDLAEVHRQRRLASPLPELIAALDRAAARLPPGRAASRARLAHERAAALLMFGRARDAADTLTAALPDLEALDPAAQSALLGNLGAARWQASDLRGAVDATVSNLRAAATHGLLGSLRAALGNLALALHAMGRGEQADALFGGALSLEVDDTDGHTGLLIRLADVRASSGDAAAARALLEPLAPVASGLHAHEIAQRRARLLALDGRLDDALAAVAAVPDGLRDDPREVRDLVAALRGADRRPSTTEACLILGLRSPREDHRAYARDRFVAAYRELPTALYRGWAIHFGADPATLPEPPAPPELPPEVEALCRPLGPALTRALARVTAVAEAKAGYPSPPEAP